MLIRLLNKKVSAKHAGKKSLLVFSICNLVHLKKKLNVYLVIICCLFRYM